MSKIVNKYTPAPPEGTATFAEGSLEGWQHYATFQAAEAISAGQAVRWESIALAGAGFTSRVVVAGAGVWALGIAAEDAAEGASVSVLLSGVYPSALVEAGAVAGDLLVPGASGVLVIADAASVAKPSAVVLDDEVDDHAPVLFFASI